MELTAIRKKKISEFAFHLSNEFSKGNATLLSAILEFEELPCYFDNYEDFFDGMLLYDARRYHIHINIDRQNTLESKRGRFTLAHELGHYFIDEHRIGLKYGTLKPHGSKHELNHYAIIETEADYFASCLLMPEQKFRKHSGGKQFELQRIMDLSESFQSSMLAVALRFVEIGTHEVMVVVSKGGIVSWYSKSNDFPAWPFRFNVGGPLPPTTVAGEFFANKQAKYTTVEEVNADDWFYPKDSRANRRMFEQCYFLESYDYVISFIWFQ